MVCQAILYANEPTWKKQLRSAAFPPPPSPRLSSSLVLFVCQERVSYIITVVLILRTRLCNIGFRFGPSRVLLALRSSWKRTPKKRGPGPPFSKSSCFKEGASVRRLAFPWPGMQVPDAHSGARLCRLPLAQRASLRLPSCQQINPSHLGTASS